MSSLRRTAITSSIILLVMFNLFNLLNLVFQITSARLLSVTDYGILATLLAFLYILVIFSESIQTVIVKYTSTNESSGKLKNLMRRAFRKTWKASFLLFVAYLLLGIFIAPLLKINYLLFALNGLTIFIVFFTPITRGLLQGRKQFFSLGSNLIFEGALKLLISVGLILLGFGVFGALVGILLALYAALFLSFIPLKDIFRSKEEHIDIGGIYTYSWPVFFAVVSIIFLTNIDLIIAKIVFEETLAGEYAIASVLAKMIFLGTQPISRAMFPLSAQHSQSRKKVLSGSLFLLVAIILLAITVFFIAPELAIYLFSQKTLAGAATILPYLAVATSILSVSNLFLFYALSKDTIKHTWILLFIIPISLVSLYIFSSTLLTFSITFTIISIIFLLASLLLILSK